MELTTSGNLWVTKWTWRWSKATPSAVYRHWDCSIW